MALGDLIYDTATSQLVYNAANSQLVYKGAYNWWDAGDVRFNITGSVTAWAFQVDWTDTDYDAVNLWYWAASIVSVVSFNAGTGTARINVGAHKMANESGYIGGLKLPDGSTCWLNAGAVEYVIGEAEPYDYEYDVSWDTDGEYVPSVSGDLQAFGYPGGAKGVPPLDIKSVEWAPGDAVEPTTWWRELTTVEYALSVAQDPNTGGSISKQILLWQTPYAYKWRVEISIVMRGSGGDVQSSVLTVWKKVSGDTPYGDYVFLERTLVGDEGDVPAADDVTAVNLSDPDA